MKIHPSPQFQFNITRDIQVISPDIQHRLKVKIIMGELRYNIDSIKRIKTEGRGGGLRGFVKQLNRSVLKASKISSTDPDFLNILEEAEAYLGIEV